jgi:predicted enzyme related to lactoylglutathione lyase
MSLPAEARAMGTVPYWRAYIGAGDVDAIVAHASRLGARILEAPRDLPAVGRAALLADPEGARFGVYRPLDGGSPPAPAFTWYELAARSRETALAFYQQLFGWQLGTAMDMGGGFFYQTFGLNGKDIGGAYTIPADRPMPPAWCPYANCASADEVAGQVIAGGGQLCHGPVDVPGGGRIVQFFDAQHAMFAVHSMPAAAAAPKPAAAKLTVRKAAMKKPAKKKSAKKKAAKKKAVRRPVAKKRSAKRRPARKKAPRSRKPARKPVRKSVRKGARRKPARKK